MDIEDKILVILQPSDTLIGKQYVNGLRVMIEEENRIAFNKGLIWATEHLTRKIYSPGEVE